ncbi:MAG TPA: phosphopantetheine-binding protein [Acidimicrobiales bacterium]|nr:phosphopantetheine-binding protein [Acidimicrobiales bacterium]
MNAEDARALLARLLRGIAPEVDLAQVDPDVPMQEELDLDSMDFLNLVTALHDETGIEVPERDYPRLATVDGFVAYVAAARAA